MSAPAIWVLVSTGLELGYAVGQRTGKGLLAAGDDYSANALVLIVLGQSFVQLCEEGAAERI